MSGALAVGRLQIRCDLCGRHYRAARGARLPLSCPKCPGTIRRETIAEQRQRRDAWAQFRVDARETMAAGRFGLVATMPSTLINRPWRSGGAIVRAK